MRLWTPHYNDRSAKRTPERNSRLAELVGPPTPLAKETDMLVAIIVGIIAGFLAGKIMSGAGYGVLVDLALGLAGGIVGQWVLGLLGIAGTGGVLWSILVATLGAVILVAIARLIRSGTRTP